MFCLPLKVLPSGMNPQVMARRQPGVMLGPAPWAIRPLWKEQEPAIHDQLADRLVILPQIDALDKNLVVIAFFIHLPILIGHSLLATLFDGVVHGPAPDF